MKQLALFKAFIHWITCGNTIIQNKGKADEWMPVTKIYCDKCGKTFYKNPNSLKS